MWEVGAEAWGQVAERSLFFHNRIQSLDSQCPSARSLRILPPGPSRETSGAASVEGLVRFQTFRIRLSWLSLPGLSLWARLSRASWISRVDNLAHLVLTPEGMRTEVPGGQFLPHPQDSLCSQSSSPAAGPRLSQAFLIPSTGRREEQVETARPQSLFSALPQGLWGAGFE